jgi:catechol 2,3-dioxygenase-like lactoylglutathione lyase family enzyme
MIQHVTREIVPSELETCVAFYRALGFDRVDPPPALADRFVWLERGGTQIHLEPVAGARPEAGHVGILVDPYPETIERLRAEGYDVEPRAEHWGSPRAYVRDPAGNLVEIIAWAPGDPRAEAP